MCTSALRSSVSWPCRMISLTDQKLGCAMIGINRTLASTTITCSARMNKQACMNKQALTRREQILPQSFSLPAQRIFRLLHWSWSVCSKSHSSGSFRSWANSTWASSWLEGGATSSSLISMLQMRSAILSA